MQLHTENRELVATLAEREGLYLVGVVRPTYSDDAKRLEQWLTDGNQADMGFLKNHHSVRSDPRLYFPPTQSVLVFCMSYWRDEFAEKPKGPGIAAYARNRDYHKVLRRKCEAVMRNFHTQSGIAEAPFRVAVDTAPIMERALAARAGRGFIGKNTLWIHPDFGSFVLLSEVFTALDFAVQDRVPLVTERKTSEGGCGPCRQCQIHCPTGALDEAYRLDARKCLAYWTIENRGTIPFQFWPHLQKFYFGCDICQTACPYNIRPRKRLPSPGDIIPHAEFDQLNWNLFTVATMDDEGYQKGFGGTPLTRAKRSGLRRNALIAMAVTGHPQLAEAMEHVSQDGGHPLEETVEQIRKYLRESAVANVE